MQPLIHTIGFSTKLIIISEHIIVMIKDLSLSNSANKINMAIIKIYNNILKATPSNNNTLIYIYLEGFILLL
jgi:hypothetical protein